MTAPDGTRLAQPPTKASVDAGLDDIRRRLRGHGGDVRVTEVTPDGTVELEFVGACNGCPALAFTYSAVVLPAVERVPGVERVNSRQTTFSPYVAARISSLQALSQSKSTQRRDKCRT